MFNGGILPYSSWVPSWGASPDDVNEPGLSARGRLLSQIAQAAVTAVTTETTQPLLETTTSTAQSSVLAIQQRLSSLSTTTLVLIIAAGLSGILIIVLVFQWAAELIAWRRRCRLQEQDEACRHHVQGYTSDIESPTKANKSLSAAFDNASHPASPEVLGGQGQPQDAAPSETTHQPAAGSSLPSGLRLPGSALLRRNPSLRSEMVSIRVLRKTSSSPRGTGSPRSPFAHRRVGYLSRKASTPRASAAFCGIPRTLEASELTVDDSLKARDVEQTGWAPNPHARRSSPSTPSSPSEGSYTFIPQLNYRLGPSTSTAEDAISPSDSPASEIESAEGHGGGSSATVQSALAGPRKHRLAHSSTAPHTLGGGTGSSLTETVTLPKPPKSLVRLVTDASQLDFQLSTLVESIDGDGEGSSSGVVNPQTGRRTSSGERTGLHTAQSILPQFASQFGAAAAATADTPTQVPRPSLSGASAGGANNVPLLTAEEFASEVHMMRLLGAGGSGSVHEALWNGRRVAVKLLHPSRQISPSSAEAFHREVALMATVGAHPYVVSVLGACLVPPSMAIITELAEGGSLHAALHEEGVRPRYGTLLQVAEDVASAMAHCHSLRLVHRDLKAHNVLLGADGRARVADFGLALSKQRTFLTLEANAGQLGTASVMAPEQFAAGQVDERCDSYAFGCLLWECVTGRQPWEECSNIMQIVMAVGCERRRPPMPKDCPAPLARLIRECWRHNSSLRPGFQEILERVKELRKEEREAAAMRAVTDAAKGEAQGTSGSGGLRGFGGGGGWNQPMLAAS